VPADQLVLGLFITHSDRDGAQDNGGADRGGMLQTGRPTDRSVLNCVPTANKMRPATCGNLVRPKKCIIKSLMTKERDQMNGKPETLPEKHIHFKQPQ